MKKIYSLMLLCAAIVFATGCSKDDDSTPTTVSVSGVMLDKTTLSIEVGKTSTLTAIVAPENATDKSVTWSSNKTDIATVTDAGIVMAVKIGTATITATTIDGEKTATCQVTVTPLTIAVTSITLDGDKSILVGAKVTPVATILPSDATVKTVAWSSSDATIATVNAATGEVEGKAVGEVTITATATDGSNVTATCKVKVEDKPNFVEVNGIKVAVGNLVADGANGAKIGTATDGGLFFQFGSLVGWSATGSPTIAVKPAAFNGKEGWAETGKIWQGTTGVVPFTATGSDDEKAGIGDPCRYYLKDTWRLPTKDEYVALFKDGGYPNGTWKWENSSATNATLGLTFPASGYRDSNDGSLFLVGSNGFYWSASPFNASNGYVLSFLSSGVYPSIGNNRALGVPVRCVQNASN